MLGRMRMSIDDCITEYQKLGSIVFGRPQGRLHEYMFDADILSQETKAVVAKYMREEDESLLDPLGEDSCKTYMILKSQEQALALTTVPWQGVVYFAVPERC